MKSKVKVPWDIQKDIREYSDNCAVNLKYKYESQTRWDQVFWNCQHLSLAFKLLSRSMKSSWVDESSHCSRQIQYPYVRFTDVHFPTAHSSRAIDFTLTIDTTDQNTTQVKDY